MVWLKQPLLRLISFIFFVLLNFSIMHECVAGNQTLNNNIKTASNNFSLHQWVQEKKNNVIKNIEQNPITTVVLMAAGTIGIIGAITALVYYVHTRGDADVSDEFHKPRHAFKHQKQSKNNTYPTFKEWKLACDRLPHFDPANRLYHTPLTANILENELRIFFTTMSQQLKKGMWIGHKPTNTFFDVSRTIFEPYVQKLVVQPGNRVAIHGDFHGDIHSINRCIQSWADAGYCDKQDPFKIVDPNFYIIFLGDYTDRGWYGAEVLYTIMRLKNTNPNRVFMTRGNHEDQDLNAHYGFAQELEHKFKDKRALHTALYRLYNFLPLALYLGCGTAQMMNFVQCCHGGIEIGYNPRPLLQSNNTQVYMRIDTLMQRDGFNVLKTVYPHIVQTISEHEFVNNTSITPANGFMWSDFIVDPDTIMKYSDRGHGMYEFGCSATETLLNHWSGNTYRIQTIFRAHQHHAHPTPMRKRILNEDNYGHPHDAGLGKLWIHNKPEHKNNAGLLQGIRAITFSVSPETGYNFPYDVFGILTTAQMYDQWRLKSYRLH